MSGKALAAGFLMAAALAKPAASALPLTMWLISDFTWFRPQAGTRLNSSDMMPRTNLHIYPSTFTNESRILKETNTLAQRQIFDQINIIAMGGDGLPTHEQLDDSRRLWRVPVFSSRLGRSSIAKALRILEWTVRILFGMLGRGVDCVNCHSLSVLPLACVIKFCWRAKLVYDTHELETESASCSGLRKRLAKVVERCLIRSCDSVIVVGDSIAEWYETTYGLTNVVTVRNKPVRSLSGNPASGNLLKERFQLTGEDRLFLYQGILERGRGLDILLEVFAQAGPQNHLVCMGYGSWEPQIRQAADKCANIHFHPAVSPAELADYTVCADVGLCVIEDCCLSYRYCLPNKLFEYLAAGIPTLISNLPDMVRVVDEFQCGWIVEPDASSVADVVNHISVAELAAKRHAANINRQQFTWDNEEPTLVAVHATDSSTTASAPESRAA